jgi:sugar phosphate isomerase/epimerase
MTQRVGVCSWSLRPTSAEQLVERLRAIGIAAVQLALDPLRTGEWPPGVAVESLGRAGVTIRSGMIGMCGEDYSTLDSIRRTGGLRPDEHWTANLDAARASARLARELGLPLVTFHAGFIPHQRDDPLRRTLLSRLRAVADLFAEQNVRVALETGQETAETLLDVLAELRHPAVGVNFDPANMLLYGMGDPVAALRQLAPHVVQIHVKDARRSRTPGRWGAETPVGEGEVDWPAFFAAMRDAGLRCDLMIERESGHDRIGDIRRAAEHIRPMIAQLGQRPSE